MTGVVLCKKRYETSNPSWGRRTGSAEGEDGGLYGLRGRSLCGVLYEIMHKARGVDGVACGEGGRGGGDGGRQEWARGEVCYGLIEEALWIFQLDSEVTLFATGHEQAAEDAATGVYRDLGGAK